MRWQPAERAPGAPRLNPFAFPSDTDLRFVLLIASVICVSIFLSYGLYFRLITDLPTATSTCWTTAQSLFPEDVNRQLAFQRDCVGPAEQRLGLWLIGGGALVLLAAGLLYWL